MALLDLGYQGKVRPVVIMSREDPQAHRGTLSVCFDVLIRGAVVHVDAGEADSILYSYLGPAYLARSSGLHTGWSLVECVHAEAVAG